MSVKNLSTADITAIAIAPMDQRKAVCQRYKIFPNTFYAIKQDPIKYLKRFKKLMKLIEPCELCSETYYKIYNNTKLCSDHYDQVKSQMLGGGIRKQKD